MPRSFERQPQPESRDSRSDQFKQIEQQLEGVIVSSAVVQADAADGLNAILLGEAFAALPSEEQAELRARYGGALPKKEDLTEARQEAVPAGEAAPAQEQAEKTETRGGRPKTWVFDNYVLKWDPETGAFLIFENKSKYDERKGIYRKNRDPQLTAITLPPELTEQLRREPDIGPRIKEFCERLRRELDGDGALVLHYDEPQKKGDDFRPKWTPTYGGARHDDRFIKIAERNDDDPGRQAERVDPLLLPPYLNKIAQEYWTLFHSLYGEEKKKNPRMSKRELSSRVRNMIPEEKRYYSKRYHRGWTDWEGKARQRLREVIITEELAKQRFESADRPATAAADEQIPAQPDVPTEMAEEVTVAPVSEAAAPVAFREEAEATPAAAVEPPEPIQTAPVPEQPAAEISRESREFERLDQEILGLCRPVYLDMLRDFGKHVKGREKMDKLKLIKLATKATLEIFKIRFEGAQDSDGLRCIQRMDFAKKLAGDIAREFTHQETSRKFFDAHTFFDERSVEVADDNRIAFNLDKAEADNESEALEQAARQLVFDALYGEAARRDEDLAGDEPRLIRLVAETLRRLKGQPADIIDYDPSANRLAVNDLETLRRIIRSKVRTAK